MTKFRIVYYSKTNRYHVEKEGWFFWRDFDLFYDGSFRSRFIFESQAKECLDRYLNPPKIIDASRVVYEVEVD